MTILWITNNILPEAESIISKGQVELKSSGGWLIGAATALIQRGIELHVASVSNLVSELKIVKGENIYHYLIPKGKGNLKYNKDYEQYWMKIHSMVSPDVVHIHGTEFTHPLSYLRVCDNSNVVVSIQGLRWVYYRYYTAGLSSREIINSLTFHDFFKGSIFSEIKVFRDVGVYEQEIIKRTKFVIGRTDWDRAHIWAINPLCKYLFCNETLRPEFYTCNKWNYSECEKESIFLSQAYYPIKGLHKVIEALPLVIRHFPNTKLRIAGTDITNSKGISGLIHFTGYGRYLKKLINKLGLKEHISFLGPLSADQMILEYQRANVFICPSSIENSPNSLGEAEIIGTPVLSSYVGGSMNMMEGLETGLYRFEEVEMLAFKICDLFKNKDYSNYDMIERAEKRHCPQRNADNLIAIYDQIAAENKVV